MRIFTIILLLLTISSAGAISLKDPAAYIQTDQTPAATIGFWEVYQRALKNNEGVASAQESYLQSVLFRRQIRSVLFPDISIEGSYFQQESIPGDPITGRSFLIPNRSTYFARIEQSLFSGFREFNGLRQSNYLIESREEGLRREKDDLLVDVGEAFFESLKQQKEVETIEDSLRLQRERLREVEARQKVGLARRTEVLLIGTQVANDESRLIRSRNALRTAGERLHFVVGEPVNQQLRDDVQEKVPDVSTEMLLQQALISRADLKSSEWQVAAAKSNVKVIRGEYLPELEFNTNIYAHREGIQSPVNWDFEISLSFPLFFGRETRAKELQALSQVRQAQLAQQQLERQVELEIKTALLAWNSADALIASLEKELDLADENYRLIQEEYRIGLANNLEVLTAYNFLQNARLDLEKERINRKLEWLRLQHALGNNPGLGR